MTADPVKAGDPTDPGSFGIMSHHFLELGIAGLARSDDRSVFASAQHRFARGEIEAALLPRCVMAGEARLLKQRLDLVALQVLRPEEVGRKDDPHGKRQCPHRSFIVTYLRPKGGISDVFARRSRTSLSYDSLHDRRCSQSLLGVSEALHRGFQESGHSCARRR